MHSAVCSSVSCGVGRPVVESSGCCMRKGGYAGDCQAVRLGVAGRSLKEGLELVGIGRIRVLRGGGAGVLLHPKAFASEEGVSAENGNVSGRENGWAEARGRSDGAKIGGGGGGEQGQSLVHALHEAATVFQSAMEEQESLTRGPWFAQKWLGIDKNAWMKGLAYQAAVHSLLQAVQEIAARGEGRDRDVHVLVQRSIMRQSAPLKDSIRQELSTRDPSADDWLWRQQHPQAVASFVSILEKDRRFTAVTSTGWEETATSSSNDSDVALLSLSLSSSAAITKLGATAVSCPPFTTLLPEEISRQMLKLPECMSIEEVYTFSCNVGFKRQFLDSFGARAADVGKWQANEKEGTFWINLIQQLLCAALVREGVHLKLQVTDGIEDLQKDLGLFGFFVALGRSTRAYLASRGVGDSEESLASLLRYLDGGSVLFYPQLSRVSSYQLFVEVVCEEMEWLSFYPGSPPANSHDDHKKVKSGASKAEKQMALGVAVETCSLWVRSFGRYSTWIRQPQGFRGTTFLEKGQQRLEECFKAYNLLGNDRIFTRDKSDSRKDDVFNGDSQRENSEGEANIKRFEDDLLRTWDVPNVTPLNTSKLPADQLGLQEMERQLKLFDKELQSVELAIHKLETLLKESESNGNTGRETLSAIRVDLRRIWALKREVESLEDSLKTEAGLLRKSLAAKEDEVLERSANDRSANEELGSRSTSSQSRNRENPVLKGATNLGRGLVNFIFPFSNLKQEREDIGDKNDITDYEADLAIEGATAFMKEVDSIEQLRGELAALENRIRQAAVQAESEGSSSSEDLTRMSNTLSTSLTTRPYEDDIDDSEVAGAYGDVFGKSIEKLKDASSDAWRGTVLLGSDVGVAVLLLKRSVAGQKLTDREQKILKRTFTDLASVVPIGFLMLLPVTAVGHAAILAAIQKYVPALIPSAYGRERLDVLRRLEQLKQLESETEDSNTRQRASK